MNPDLFKDEMWLEIPDHVFIPLGRRGQEAIDLHQCFNPNCSESEENRLHPLKKEEIQDDSKESANLTEEQPKKIVYSIFCENCETSFDLIFKRHYLPETNQVSEDNDSIANANKVVYEQVSARNSNTLDNYGEIGFVQYRR